MENLWGLHDAFSGSQKCVLSYKHPNNLFSYGTAEFTKASVCRLEYHLIKVNAMNTKMSFNTERN
jgi:hypothetical protein